MAAAWDRRFIPSPATALRVPRDHGVTGELELLCIPLAELLLLFAVPLLVPYWSLVPPLSQPAKTNATAAPAIKIIFFMSIVSLFAVAANFASNLNAGRFASTR